VDRPKRGFGVPLGMWFRDELRDFVTSTLTPERMRRVGIEDFRTVQRTLDSHMTGAFNEQPRLWTLVVLSLWHDAQRGQPRDSATAIAAAS